jgi:probable HAF family extracellular repeat protein
MRTSRKSTPLARARGAGATTLMLLLLVALVSVAPSAAQTTLDYPGAVATVASGINDLGTIVGSYYNSDGSEHGFLYDGKTFTGFDYPEAAWTEPAGINQAGDVVGYYGYATDNLMHGFLRTADKKFSTIDRLGRFNTMPFGINSSLTIVGCMHNPGTMHGWTMQNGVFISLSPAYEMYTAINDPGTIVGWYYAAPGSIRSFVLSGTGQMDFDYPGATNTQAYGINVYGTVVGWYGLAASSHGFELSNGQFTSIDVSGATRTRAFGINSPGTIVGYFVDATGGIHGFIR